MQRRSEWIGIGAVILFVVAMLAYQFLPASDDLADGVVRVDATEQAAEPNDSSEASSNGSDFSSDSSANNADTDGSDTDGYDTVVVYDWIIDVQDLPDEAWDTLYLIDDNGPYPYDKDGTTFQNREGLLPDHPRGHYREFTVETPGLSHRGALRIVSGADGELYWTDDHYDSFAQIVGW